MGGSQINTAISMSGSELAKATCGSEGNVMWRSSPDLLEGSAFQKNSGSFEFGVFSLLKAPALIPAIAKESISKSNYVLILDNLRATGVLHEGGEAAYVYAGGQFCQDR